MNLHWKGEPYKSDFVSPIETVRLHEIYDGRHCSTAMAAKREADKNGFKFFISPKKSKYGQDLYYSRQSGKCNCIQSRYNIAEKKRVKENERYKSSIDERIKQIIRNSKVRAASKKIDFDLNVENIIERVKNGVCEATGLKLDLSIEGISSNRNPYTPSIDRVDNTKGYTMDNVMVVCLGYNLIKSSFSIQDLHMFCSLILEKSLFLDKNSKVSSRL